MQLVAPALLTKPIVSGVTTVAKPAPKGWRDTVALVATALGICFGMGFGVVVSGGSIVAGGAGAVLVAVVGYNKQFWRTAFKRSTRVSTVRMLPAPPHGETITGVAKPHDRELPDNVIAFATETTYMFDDQVIARTTAAVPFWIVDGERRVLVDGVLRLWASPGLAWGGNAVKNLADLGIAIRRADRKRTHVRAVSVMPGARVTATGALTTKQLADGYRDHLVDALVGEPGRPVVVDVL